jgi:hypothetical protein
VVVAVAGVLLSAWLLPAMTRQWSDREKEHELKAAVVGDMAAATARALVGAEAIWSQNVTRQTRVRIGDQWELSSLQIEARLRTYFSKSVVTGWEIYAWAVDRFINARRVSSAAALQDAVGEEVKLDPRVADAAANLLYLAKNTDGRVPSYSPNPGSTSDGKNLSKLKAMLSTENHQDNGQIVVSRWTALEKSLLGFEQAVADHVLLSRATGFSTTWQDLLRDLLP